MQQDTQLALANLVTTTASDQNAVYFLTKTIAHLTTELASANSDIRRIRGDTFLPPNATTRRRGNHFPFVKTQKKLLGIQRVTVGHMDKKSPSDTHTNHSRITWMTSTRRMPPMRILKTDALGKRCRFTKYYDKGIPAIVYMPIILVWII